MQHKKGVVPVLFILVQTQCNAGEPQSLREPRAGFDPATDGLRNRCSTELSHRGTSSNHCRFGILTIRKRKAKRLAFYVPFIDELLLSDLEAHFLVQQNRLRHVPIIHS